MKINPGNARGLLVPQGDRPFSFVVYSSEIRDFGIKRIFIRDKSWIFLTKILDDNITTVRAIIVRNYPFFYHRKNAIQRSKQCFSFILNTNKRPWLHKRQISIRHFTNSSLHRYSAKIILDCLSKIWEHSLRPDLNCGRS